MMSNISVLNSYGKESKSEKFTRPLRGVLGGKKVTIETGKNKKIYNFAERILLAPVLFTIGIPYTIAAGLVLAFSSSKKMTTTHHSVPNDPSETVPTITKDQFSVDVYDSFTDEQLIALSYLFDKSPINWKKAVFLNPPYNYSYGRENIQEDLCQLNEPTMVSIRRSHELYISLVIPMEVKGDDGKWERTFCMIGEQGFLADKSFSLSIHWCDDKVDLNQFDKSSPQFKTHNALMKGDVVTIDGNKFRLYSVLNS